MKTKKYISLVLVIALMLTLLSEVANANANAQADANANDVNQIARNSCYEVFHVDNGTYYSYIIDKDNAEWNVIQFVGTDGTFRITSRQLDSHLIYVNTLDIPDVRGYSAKRLGDIAFQYCDYTLGAEIYSALDCESEKDIPTRDSVWADLRSELIQREGNEIDDFIVYQPTHYVGVNSVDIWWTSSHHCTKIGTKTFGVGTLLEIVAQQIGYASESAILLSLLCKVVSYAYNYISELSRIEYYWVDCAYVLYGTVNGGGYSYCQAQKIRRYVGLNELNNWKRAYIASTGTNIYVPSYQPELYNHYYLLADKTYRLWRGY